MFEAFMAQWGLPVFGLVFAIIAIAWALRASREFDRKHGE